MQLVEPRAQEELGPVRLVMTASGEQPAHRLGQAQLIDEPGHDGRVGRLWEQPPCARAVANGGGGHPGKLGPPPGPYKHHSDAYRSMPQPSHTSSAPVLVIDERRCTGMTVSQLLHEPARSGKST